MRGLIYDGSLRLSETLPQPKPLEHEALVAVNLAGICNTDLEIVRGYKGFTGVLGHEFVGRVVSCRDASWLNKRVCGEINLVCGSCDHCRAGSSTHCRNRTVLGILGHDGAFAEYVTLPIANLHTLPDSISDDEAVFVEPLAAAFEILEQVPINAADRVAVLGDGKLGLLCAQVLAGTAADVWLLGRHDSKIALARDLGLRASTAKDAAGEEFDVIVEATGSPVGFERALSMVRPRGTIVLKSTVADPISLDLSPVVVNEITVVGSRCGPFPRAIAALVQGAIQVRPLIAARYPLGRGVAAMQRAAQPGTLKALLEIGEL